MARLRCAAVGIVYSIFPDADQESPYPKKRYSRPFSIGSMVHLR